MIGLQVACVVLAVPIALLGFVLLGAGYGLMLLAALVATLPGRAPR